MSGCSELLWKILCFGSDTHFVVVVVLLGEHVNNFKNIYILNWLFSLL